MKTLWIIANWKSNKTVAEALDWIGQVGPKLERRDEMKIVVCPPFTDVEEVKKAVLVGGYPLMVGVQDLSPFSEGAYTGEEAASIMRDFIELAILGHSERRENFGDTDQMVAEKVKQSLEHNIIPLVCVQNDQGIIPEGCKLAAYEPIFAIGTGNPDTPENANKVAQILKEKYGQDLPAGRQDLEVLYGGSITHENAKAFTGQENINGLLIGKASLDPDEFVRIVSACR